MDKISIIIPIYNVDKFLERCLDSIVQQSYSNLEIICINDGSTDNSLKICNLFKEKDNRIQVISQKNKGLASVRNLGIKLATSNLICFIDSDDYIEFDFIEKLYFCLKEYEADMVVSNVRYISANTKNKYLLTEEYKDKYLLTREEAMKDYLKLNGGLGNYIVNKLYRIDIFKNVTFPEGKLFEDAFSMFKLIHNANKIAIEKDAIYNYCLRDESITGSYQPSINNYDLLDANEEKTLFICKEYPNLKDYAFHQYFIAFMWFLHNSNSNSEELIFLKKYLKKIKSIKKKYHIKFLDKKNRGAYFLIVLNLRSYLFLYKTIRNIRFLKY